MAQDYVYPASSNVTLTGSTNGTPIPTTSIVVGGENASGNVEPLQLTNSGALIVTPLAGSTTDVNLTEVGGAAITEGQKTSAASIPVVLASDQSSIPVTVGNFPATQPVSGTVTVVQPTAANLNATVTGNVAISSLPSIPAGANAIGSVSVSNFPATQPISGSVTVTQTTGTNLHTVVDNTVSVTGTFFQTTQPVSIAAPVAVTGTFFQATQPVSIAAPVILGAGTASIGTVKSQASTPAALTVTQAAVTVGTTAVRITVSGSAPSATRVVLVATPDTASTATFYIGSSTVTNSGATRGVEIVAGQSFIANNDAGDYWIVSSTAAQTVTIMEQA